MDPEVRQFFEELTGGVKKSAGEDIRPPVILEFKDSYSPDIELTKTRVDKAKKTEISVNRSSKTLPESFDGTEGQLTVDVYENPNEIIIESTIAGARPEDVDINITKNSITIRGKRERERKIEEGNFLYQECYWGHFSRSVVFKEEVDPDGAEASLKNGILTIKIPKVNHSKSKKLKIK